MDVTQAWMTGVVTAMLVFGAFALVGYFKKRIREGARRRADQGG